MVHTASFHWNYRSTRDDHNYFINSSEKTKEII